MVELSTPLRGELRSIQYLRAVAAGLVVAFHIEAQLGRFGFPRAPEATLAAGVDLFFVISGFIMWLTTARNPPTPLGFYMRRFIRIAPLYWIITSVVVACSAVAPQLMQSARFDPTHVVASYLFVAWPHPSIPGAFPVLVPGWTLNYEMFFYLVFGAALTLPAGRRLGVTAAVLGLLVAIGAVLKPAGIAAFYTHEVMLEFLFGMGLGWAFLNWRAPPRAAGWTLILLGAVAMAAAGAGGPVPVRSLMFGVPAAGVVLGALILERTGGVAQVRPWGLLGDASYATYLTHGLLLSALVQVAARLHPPPGPITWLAFAMAAMAAVLAFGVATHLLVEKPAARWLRRRVDAASRARLDASTV